MHSIEFWIVVFGSIFLALRLVFRVWKRLNLYQDTQPALAASRVVAIIHSTIIAYWCFQEYGSASYPFDARDVWKLLDAPLTPRHLNMVCFSLGYFLYDFVYMIVYERDFAFLLHHVSALSIFGAVYWKERGAVILLVGLSWGEVTNPLQSSWWLARTANKAGRLNAIIAPLFTAVFLFVRFTALPYYVLSAAYALLAQPYGPMQVSLAVRANWAFFFAAFTVGGWFWCVSLIRGCFKKRKTGVALGSAGGVALKNADAGGAASAGGSSSNKKTE